MEPPRESKCSSAGAPWRSALGESEGSKSMYSGAEAK